MKQADKMLMGRYLNTAHRSTYWTQHLASLSASIANPIALEGRIFPSYPNFLRRGGSMSRPSIIEKLSSLSGTSKATTRDEFLPALMLLGREDSPLGDANDFQTSLRIGLTAEEHAALCGLAASRRSTKELVKTYREAEEEYLAKNDEKKYVKIDPPSSPPREEEPVKLVEVEEKESPDPNQMKLF